MPAIASDETRSVAAALAGIGRRLREVGILAGQADGLAVRECREDEAMDRLREALGDLDAALSDAARALAAAAEAERDLTERGDLTYAEHIAQERGMHRWRAVA